MTKKDDRSCVRRSAAIFAAAAALFLSGTSAHAAAKLGVAASAEMGHESNVRLDSSGKSDWFSGESVSAQFRPGAGGAVDWFTSYSVWNRNYFEYTPADYVYQVFRTGPDWRLGPNVVLETRYRFAYILYREDTGLDFFDHGAEIALRKDYGRNFRVKGGMNYIYRAYDIRKARLASGIFSLSTEREDSQYSMFTAFTARFTPQIGSHFVYTYRLNESNYLFQDYYDYDEHAIRVYTVWAIDPRWSVSGSFGYEYRTYDHRALVNDRQTGQDDTNYLAGATVKRALTPNLSLLYRYSWRSKESNEPSHEYRDRTNTLSLQYVF